MILNAEEQQRYSRHILLAEVGVEGQEKLKRARILIVGAGGLGCPVLQYLTAAGVGKIGIIDPDVVSISNLQRQILYNDTEIGKPKVEIAVEKLSKQNPNVSFIAYNQYFTAKNAFSVVENFDLVVDCTDNRKTRYVINDVCIKANKPMVYGAIFQYEGQVAVFNYEEGKNLRDFFPAEPKSDSENVNQRIGLLGVMPAIIGSLQANEVLKIILKIGTPLKNKLFVINALDLTNYCFEV